MTRPSGVTLAETLMAALSLTGYNNPMDLKNPRPNSVCCGEVGDQLNRLSLFNWRKARVFIPVVATAGVSLVINKGAGVLNQNGPDETNPVTGAVDTLSDQFMEEKGAPVPTDCYFAIIGIGSEMCEVFNAPSSGQANPGEPTYQEFWGSELAQSYNMQLKTAMMRHSHPEIRRKGNSCTFAGGDWAQYPSDAGVMSWRSPRAGQPLVNQFAFMRTPVIVSGAFESGAPQIILSIDRTITISNHAANPIPATAQNTTNYLPMDVKLYGVSLSPAMGCA